MAGIGPAAVTLRPAAPDDAEAIAALFSASRRLLAFLPELHSVEEDRQFIRDMVMPDCVVTVAVHDGAIAGFIAERDGWIEHLYVGPHRLGAGVGSALLAQAQNRNERLDLWCFAANRRARTFYERHGFVAIEETDGAGNEAHAPDIRYRWQR